MLAARSPGASRLSWRLVPDRERLAVEDIRKALVAREGGLFLFTDLDGTIPLDNDGGFGLYHDDTRYLSGWDLSVQGMEPIVLLSTAAMGFGQEQVMTNRELVNGSNEVLERGLVEIRRQRVLQDSFIEQVRITSFASEALTLTLVYQYQTDFVDVFELRGFARRERGLRLATKLRRKGLTFGYKGADDIKRTLAIDFRRTPHRITARKAEFEFTIAPGGSEEFEVTMAVNGSGRKISSSLRQITQRLDRDHKAWQQSGTQVVTSNQLFNASLDRSVADLRMLWTEDASGGYFAAGVPWYDALFGRDSALSSMMILWSRPEIAREVLRSLSHCQGAVVDPSREEEPGKIVHEVRRGEMANTRQVVFGRYYGSVDATPLFVLLAAEYYRWTGDLHLMQELRTSIDAALDWVDRFGDADGDGFVEYERKGDAGLINHGWKDSDEGITDERGNALKPPIALVEVQGYVFAAKLGIADVYEDLGEPSRAEQLRREAGALRRKINERFWLAEGYYALALDGNKKLSRVRASNAGHLLWCGVPSRPKAESQIEKFKENEFFSGWGIRTLSSDSKGYNPIGYHRGTVWPHDNALIIAGLKRYGAETSLNEIATGLFDAACASRYYRLPEVFSGSPRAPQQEPVPYPVANKPQAFSAAAIPSVLSSILGLAPDARHGRLYLVNPRLPFWLDFVRLRDLRVGDGAIDLMFERRGSRTVVETISQTGPIEVLKRRRWPSR